jgi:ABC-type nitrate/sulfonate/bicarbonate transport system substrate-binding protein
MPFWVGRRSRRNCAPRHVGHVILNTAVDRPWSQYFCCMLVGTREYVRNYPVATKRVLRAILKAAEFCAIEPARVAQRLVMRRRRITSEIALLPARAA